MADSEEAIRSLEMELAMSQEKHRTCTQEVQHCQQCFNTLVSNSDILKRAKQRRNLNLNLIPKMFTFCDIDFRCMEKGCYQSNLSEISLFGSPTISEVNYNGVIFAFASRLPNETRQF